MKNPFKELISLFLCVPAVFSSCSCEKRQSKINPLSSQDSLKYERFAALVKAEYQSKERIKQESADFILESLNYHYSVSGSKSDFYSHVIKNNASNPYRIAELIKNLNGSELGNDRIEQDISSMTLPYFNRNIESAVRTYTANKVWSKDIPFDNFCNYVLPYRIGHEELSNWRTYFLKLYFKEHDRSIFKKDLRLALNDIHKWLYNRKKAYKVSFGIRSLGYPELPPALLDQIIEGSCQELSYVSISLLRSLGIPAAHEFIPTQLNLNNGHEWCAVLFRDSSVTFDMLAPRVNGKDKNYLPSKVYRKSFQPVKGNHFDERGYVSYLPSFFNDPFLSDATKYYAETSNIRAPITRKPAGSPEYCYLSVFNVFTPTTWAEVGWGKIKGSDYTFNDVCRKGVYLPVYFRRGKSVPLGNPFLLTEEGTIKPINPDTLHLVPVKLYRKFTINSEKRRWLRRMICGTFQGANRADFSDAKELYEIAENPGEHLNTVELSNSGKFRFVRYLAPKEAHGSIAELRFYEDKPDKTPLKGRVLGTISGVPSNPKCTREAVFDGDALTYFETGQADSVWVGLDLGEKKTINKIQFMARTDRNAVQIGNTYELFYWNNKWKSLGVQVADSPYVVFQAPRNALLWLRNLTEGVEERIFTYQNGTQVWW